jgi:molybdenum cofactor cytidylyltransferase
LAITGILLAAGSGSRFGGGKLLHPLSDGTPIGVASLRSLKAAVGDVVAVVREGDERLREALAAEDVRVALCMDASVGQSRSLVCGVRASMDAAGWVFALGDMPFVAPATTRAIAAALADADGIVLPQYQGKRGNPVGFSARYRPLLLDLEGDEGARSIVRQRSAEIRLVECDDPGILRDIDRREDLGKP